MKFKDLYKLLGVEKESTREDMVAAYQRHAQELHPDKNMDLSEDKRKEKEERLKDISFAFTTLSNSAKKRKYDDMLNQFRESGNETCGNDAPANSNAESAHNTNEHSNPFTINPEDEADLKDIFGDEWFRIYETKMDDAEARHKESMGELEAMFNRVDEETASMARRMDESAQEIARRI